MIIHIKDGNIINKDQYFDFMLNLKDGEYIIKPYKKTRSDDQNRYYWGLLSIVEKETGISTQEIHEKMKMKFLYVPGEGKKLPFCKSTAQLKTNEFSEYIENIKNFMAQFNIILPEAEQWSIE